MSSWKAVTAAELRDDEGLNYDKGCESGVDVGLGEWVRMAQISSLRGMKESPVTTTSLTSVPGGWGCIYCVGDPGGVGGNLGEKRDFGSVSFDLGMPVGYLREGVPITA